MKKYQIEEKVLDKIVYNIANRIYNEVPEIPKTAGSRNWLQSLALDELSKILKIKGDK